MKLQSISTDGDGKVMADGTVMSCVLVVKNYVKHYFMSVG